MSKAPLFSVVVPMYNVEKFLPVCVESIRNQTLYDIEIILVDDGSPDCCGEIAEEYASRDSRIRVVHRENGGLGPARNSGMEVACGEYIGFVDSDDWIEPDMYERLYDAAKANAADVVFTGMKTVRHGNVDSVLENPFAGRTLRGPNEVFELRRGFYGAAPARVKDEPTLVSVDVGGYKRSFIEDNRLRFFAVRSEDKFFNTIACRVAGTVTCIAGTPYCYRKDDQPSITKSFDRKTIDSFFRLFRLLEQMAEEEPAQYWDECRVREQRCVLDYCRVLIGMIEDSPEDDAAKTAYIREVLTHPVLRHACEGYPWWKLPVQQAAFFLVLKARSVALARSLTRLKRGR
jgi:glycosyltransferase involved in cell wall biosynthesis